MSRCLSFRYLKALLWKHPSLSGRGAQGFLELLVIFPHPPISFLLYSSPCFGHKRNDQGQNCPKTRAGFNPNSCRKPDHHSPPVPTGERGKHGGRTGGLISGQLLRCQCSEVAAAKCSLTVITGELN